MGIVEKEELKKILKHKKKLSIFYNKVWRLSLKAPNSNIKENLRKAMSECDELIGSLTGARPLDEQIKE